MARNRLDDLLRRLRAAGAVEEDGVAGEGGEAGAHVIHATEGRDALMKIPRRPDTDDYTRDAADERLRFVREQTGADLEHVGSYSFDPTILPGNVENFIGVAQVPIGLAGPLLVNGEHAKGEFFVPLATTEGTLVASYNRGMKLMREAGGITTTVLDDRMQRAPVFLFESARGVKEFSIWLKANFTDIKAKAETTTGTGKLRDIQQFPASRFLYLRFNYTT